MNFSDFFYGQLFLEKSNIYYKVPSNKRMKMMDFYLLSYVNYLTDNAEEFLHGKIRNFPEGLKVSVKEAYKSIVDSLEKDFIRDVLFSICSETRHNSVSVDYIKNLYNNQKNNKFILINGQKFLDNVNVKISPDKKTFQFYVNKYGGWGDPIQIDPDTKIEWTDPFSSNEYIKNIEWINRIYEDVIRSDKVPLPKSDFEIILKRINDPYEISLTSLRVRKFVSFVSDLFLDQRIFFSSETPSYNYAGKPWSNIADAWLRLRDASDNDLNEKSVAIDHIYDLQHNTGSVFTKLKEYEIGEGFEWLTDALDFKRDIADFYELLTHRFQMGGGKTESSISSDAKTIALQVIRLVKNTTQEQWSKFAEKDLTDRRRLIQQHNSIIEYAENVSRRNTDFYIQNQNIISLPDNLNIKTTAFIEYENLIQDLPDNLNVRGILQIKSCPKFSKLNGNLKVTESIRVINCDSFTNIENTTFVPELIIQNCKNLKQLPERNRCSRIAIINCENFEHIPVSQYYGDVYLILSDNLPFIKKYLQNEKDIKIIRNQIVSEYKLSGVKIVPSDTNLSLTNRSGLSFETFLNQI